MAQGSKAMEVDSSDGSNCEAQPSKEKRLPVATTVAAGSSGEGLPYAPEGWPHPGDIWTWKVGQRQSARGHWKDRCIFPPNHFPHSSTRGRGFYSKLSLEQYIRSEFPEVDVDAFFASFTWKIPCDTAGEDSERSSFTYRNRRSIDFNGSSKSEPAFGPGDCKAGNKTCSLRPKGSSHSLPAMSCDICCSEIGFCRDCSCILCCKSVDWEYGGYSFVRCEARVDENYICGHVAHLECALRAYLAGTVGGSIGLDAEYYCRRCDNRTDLILHVSKLIKSCESLDSRDDVEKFLNLGLCVVRGSVQEGGKDLLNHIAILVDKLQRGVNLDDIWKMEDNTSAHTEDAHLFKSEVTVLGAADVTRNNVEPSETESVDRRAAQITTSDRSNVSMNFEDCIGGALEKLKKSQESEYRLAERKLYAQKDLLRGLYQQLEAEGSELAYNSIKHEEAKLEKMMQIVNGFGVTPKSVLTEYFGLLIGD